MSWDATFYARADGHSIQVGDWNYTHNCNGMIQKVLDVLGKESERAWWDRIAQRPGQSWWKHLHGLNGEASAELLDQIIGGLMEAPELFRAMNPENGWGDYDSLVRVLGEMRDTALKYPSGEWSTSG